MFKNKKLIFFAVFAACLLSILSTIPAVRPSFLGALNYPLAIVASLRRQMSAIIFYHRNFIQNESLKKEIDALKSKLNSLENIYLENARLANLISFKRQSPYQTIAARVIGRSADSWSSNIIIDKGKRQGIKKQMAVVTDLGLVGRVIEAQESVSRVLLICDPNLGVSCLVQRSRQEGLVSGTLGTNLIMRYLPKQADIKLNDVIITSGLNGTYPKAVLIGTVTAIGREFSGLSSYAIIKPAVNLSSIEEVLVIIQ